jgi:hypothetical protein
VTGLSPAAFFSSSFRTRSSNARCAFSQQHDSSCARKPIVKALRHTATPLTCYPNSGAGGIQPEVDHVSADVESPGRRLDRPSSSRNRHRGLFGDEEATAQPGSLVFDVLVPDSAATVVQGWGRRVTEKAVANPSPHPAEYSASNKRSEERSRHGKSDLRKGPWT